MLLKHLDNNVLPYTLIKLEFLGRSNILLLMLSLLQFLVMNMFVQKDMLIKLKLILK